MARMYPRNLLEDEVQSKAEIRAFEVLHEGLPDDWEAFHSSAWLLRDAAEGAKAGEIDFVLVHPERGVLCLEVKGGGIECRHGEWYRLERTATGTTRERIKDPFHQALDHRYALERQLAGHPELKGRPLLIGHALAFPFVTIHQLDLAPDAPREILLDRHAVTRNAIEEAVTGVLDWHRGARDRREPPAADGAEAIRNILAPRVRIEVPMAAEFLEEEEALVLLTHEQTVALERMRRDPRMVVTGCAGSGKTMLAVEHSKRLAREGKRVLFVCFNRALRDHLRAKERAPGLTFNTFHGACTALARKAKVDLPDHDGEPPQSYWHDDLPDALVEASDRLEERYDAIVIDEAQDLQDHWLAALMTLLGDEEKDQVWLFMDDNQRVYDVKLGVPAEFRPYDLTLNCRNTQAIHREVVRLYEGEVRPEAKGPEGREIELLRSDDQPATVAAVLERLCGKEEVPPQDVVVLSSHGFERSPVAQSLPGRFRPTQERGKHGRYVHCSSIRGFKGLESPVVVLCELEDLDEETRNQQLYVGMSRARNHCVLVVPEGSR